MRTTLKRGLGRGAAPNGNGKAVFPPGTSSPVTLYRQPELLRRSRAGLIGRIAMWLGVACLVVATGTAGGAYLYFHESVAAVAAKTPEVRKAARPSSTSPFRANLRCRSSSATTTVRGTGRAPLGRSDTLMLVRADPSTDSIALLSFPRDMRVEIRCPGRTPFFDKINAAYATCGPQGSLQTVTRADRRPDQLPDHGQLPRLPADRRPSRRGVGRRRPALLQRPRRPVRLRDDQPPSGLPAADGAADARLRALPPHGLRPLPRGTSAAVRQGVQGPDSGELRARRVAEGRQCDHEQRRGRAGWRRRRRRSHGALVRALRVRAPARAGIPDADRGPRGRLGSHDGLDERHARGHELHAPGRRVVREGDGGGARRESEEACARAERDHDHRAERKRGLGLGDDRRLTSSASARTRCSRRRTDSPRMRRRSTTSARRSTSTARGAVRRRLARRSRTSSPPPS